MTRPPIAFAIFVVLTLVRPCATRGEVGDPTLTTNHPFHAGEGAFQTAADCARFAVGDKTKPQDRALAMYSWLLTHQWHLPSPQEWRVPGAAPDTRRDGQEDSIVWDAAAARFSYGYGLCGTVHAWNEPYWRALGMPARRRAFPGHTNSEIFYDDAWHAFDTDMAGLLFRRDGVVAGYADIQRDPGLIDSTRPPIPHYPFAWPGDFRAMQAGWREVAKKKDWFCLYNGGHETMPGVVHLRHGESFTRWFDPDHYGGPTKRRFWHHQHNGPLRDWTFANAGEPRHDRDQHNARGGASYCNGEFVYRPPLTSDRFREGVVAASANLARGETSPRLRSADGQPAFVVFGHWSPYVICGDPVDDANPMTGRATDGFVLAGKLVGEVALELSADEGQTWQAIAAPRLPLDLTEHVKGRRGWRARFVMSGRSGVDELAFTTVTQVGQAIYPRLKPGGCDVIYRQTGRAALELSPNFGLPEAEAGAFEDVSRRSANLAYRGRGPQSRLAYQTTNNKPAQVVFPLTALTELVETRVAARHQVRVPPPEKHDFRIDVSVDEGRSWRPLARADIPPDNEHSSGWMYGAADVADARSPRALVRLTLYAGGHATGLLDARLYALRHVGEPEALTVTQGWREGGAARTHREIVPAGAKEHRWKIATGADIRDEFVRLSAAGE